MIDFKPKSDKLIDQLVNMIILSLRFRTAIFFFLYRRNQYLGSFIIFTILFSGYFMSSF